MPIIPIYLPKIGESVSEATIVQWLKNEGDSIQKDEVFVEISTDKVTSELPSEFEGVLVTILIAKNEIAQIGEPIARLEVNQQVYDQWSKEHSLQTEAQQKSEKPPTSKNQLLSHKEIHEIFLSPVVRKIAQQENLSIEVLSQIPSTGNNERLTKQDVLQYLAKTKYRLENQSQHIPQKLDLPIEPEDQVKPLVGIRKKAAEILSESYREIPHVTTMIEMDVSTLVQLRNQWKKNYFDQYNLKLTYTHFCFYALIRALQKYPALNSWYNQEEWIVKKSIHLGFATSIDDDLLIVPNIKNAQSFAFLDLVREINETAQRAKSNQLQAVDFKWTTFTLSNTGMFGSLMGTPIISKPQVGILALGEIRTVYVLNKEGNVEEKRKMFASLSYDHRVINGALASKFLVAFREFLQNIPE